MTRDQMKSRSLARPSHSVVDRHFAVEDQRVGAGVARRFREVDAAAVVLGIEVAVDEARLGVAELGAAKDLAQLVVLVRALPVAEVAEEADLALEPVEHIGDLLS